MIWEIDLGLAYSGYGLKRTVSRMKLDKRTIQLIVFNVAETALIFLIGLTLKLDITYILILMFVFLISRSCFSTTLHFKKWYKCLIWSSLILFSLFTILKISLPISIVFTIFAAFIMTGKADIRDMYLWSGKTSKYDALRDLIEVSPNHSILLEHEDYWRKNYPIRYEIFVLYFRERRTYEYIAKLKGFDDNTIIKRECATIYSVLERPLGLPPVEKK